MFSLGMQMVPSRSRHVAASEVIGGRVVGLAFLAWHSGLTGSRCMLERFAIQKKCVLLRGWKPNKC